MGNLFQVSYDRFKQEIIHEKITPESKDKLECEDLGSGFAYYLTSFDRPKTFVYVVLKTEITDVQRVYLTPLSELSTRITDSSKLMAIAQTLERIELALQTKPLQEKVVETVEVPSEP